MYHPVYVVSCEEVWRSSNRIYDAIRGQLTVDNPYTGEHERIAITESTGKLLPTLRNLEKILVSSRSRDPGPIGI